MNKKRIIIIGGMVGILAVGGYLLVGQQQASQESAIQQAMQEGLFFEDFTTEVKDLTYTKGDLPKEHVFEKGKMSPLIGSALVDLDGNGVDEVFIGGGYNQNDTWYEYRDGKMVDITQKLRWQKNEAATYGTAIVDYDNDQDGDIFVARVDGIYYYENKNGTEFSAGEKIEAFLEEGSIPTGIALGDLNNDGQVDMFVSTYLRHDRIEGTTIFNKEAHGTISRLLLGKGSLVFEDITEDSSLLYRHNTFAGTFSDLDNDNDLDLVVAYDTGSARIYENQGNLKFSLVKGTSWENKYGYPMGIGIGDINDDGLQDIFFSNTGNSSPDFLLRGDLRKDQELLKDWKLYQNKGSMEFVDETKKMQLKEHEFAWGGVITDIDKNGKEDLIVSENYIKIPQHRIKPLPGRVFFQDSKGDFIPQEGALKIENPHFSLSSLVFDWNQDSVQDILWVNISGASELRMSSISNNRATDTIIVPYETRFLGSRWQVTWEDGATLSWHYTPTEGLGSTQSNVWSFLSRSSKPKMIRVELIGGSQEDGMKWYQAGENR
ncbi:MAG: VCBS repeat-containing protein [Candidatus Moranbacteria bacterium]|nr:VCBS repeat-containing protein [Candidatus Moranbacteria bacterium]